jgi:hypothetical protein
MGATSLVNVTRGGAVGCAARATIVTATHGTINAIAVPAMKRLVIVQSP